MNWTILLFVIAAFLTVRALLQLMQDHRIRHQYVLLAAALKQEREAKKNAQAEAADKQTSETEPTGDQQAPPQRKAA